MKAQLSLLNMQYEDALNEIILIQEDVDNFVWVFKFLLYIFTVLIFILKITVFCIFLILCLYLCLNYIYLLQIEFFFVFRKLGDEKILIYFNNIATIYYYMRKPNLSSFFFNKAYGVYSFPKFKKMPSKYICITIYIRFSEISIKIVKLLRPICIIAK